MKAKTFRVTRVVREFYYVDAIDRKDALKIVGDRGSPSKVVIVSEKVVPTKTTPTE